MSTVYNHEIDMAHRLIARKGQKTTIKKHIDGTKDPVSQTETGGSDVSVITKGVFLPPGMTYSKEAGGLVRLVNHTIYISPKGLAIDAPVSGDIVSDKNNANYIVDSTTEYKPDGTPVLWVVLAKLA